MSAPPPMVDRSYCAARCAWLVFPALTALVLTGLWLGWRVAVGPENASAYAGAAGASEGAASLADPGRVEPDRTSESALSSTPLGRRVRIDVLSRPPGARVEIAGVSVGTTPLRAVPVRVGDDGRVPLTLRRPGYRDAHGALRVRPDLDSGRVEIALEPEDMR